MEPEDTKAGGEPVPTPAPKTRWIGTGLGCLALALVCGFAMFAAIAYGMGHANNQGNAVFQSVLIGAPIVALILGVCWISIRDRGPQ